MSIRSLLALSGFLLSVALCACSAPGVGTTPPAGYPVSGLSLGSDSNAPLIFIADFSKSDVEIFSSGSSPTLLGTITNGVANPEQIAFDAKDTLYVTNTFANTVNEYPRGKTSPTFTLSTGLNAPNGIAVDSKGTVYVSNNPGNGGTIVEYKHGSNKPFLTISGISNPLGLALDSKDNLYIGGEVSGVYEVLKGKSQPSNLGLQSTGFVVGVALAKNGDLYVGNCNPQNNITVYHHGQTSPYETINYNGDCAYYLSLDKTSNLYVGYVFNAVMAIYPPGKTSPSVTVTQGLTEPTSAVLATWPKP